MSTIADPAAPDRSASDDAYTHVGKQILALGIHYADAADPMAAAFIVDKLNDRSDIKGERETIARYVERYAKRLEEGPEHRELSAPINRIRYSEDEIAIVVPILNAVAGAIRADLPPETYWPDLLPDPFAPTEWAVEYRVDEQS